MATKKVTIEIEYEIFGDGCKDAELEILKKCGNDGSGIIGDGYEILLESMEIVEIV